MPPVDLIKAWEWTDAAGEIDELARAAHLDEAGQGQVLLDYCRSSSYNASEHGEHITEVELYRLAHWLRANTTLGQVMS